MDLLDTYYLPNNKIILSLFNRDNDKTYDEKGERKLKFLYYIRVMIFCIDGEQDEEEYRNKLIEHYKILNENKDIGNMGYKETIELINCLYTKDIDEEIIGLINYTYEKRVDYAIREKDFNLSLEILKNLAREEFEDWYMDQMEKDLN